MAATRRPLRVEVDSAALNLDLPTVGAGWTVPLGIERDKGFLVWRPDATRRPVRDPAPDFLLRFAGLADLPEDRFEDAVVRYASQWGLLGLCQHDLPGTHGSRRGAPRSDQATDACHVWGFADGCRAERIGPWRHIASQMNAILRATALIVGGGRVSADLRAALEDLVPLGFWPQTPSASVQSKRLLKEGEVQRTWGKIGSITLRVFADDREAVAYVMRRLLDMADVRPVFTWTRRHTSAGFGSDTLFGGLTLRLAGVVANRTQSPKLCRYCDSLYEPRPREHRSTDFCERDECKLARGAENAKRKRVGDAKVRGPYKSRTTSPLEADARRA